MQRLEGRIVYSASDLNDYLECLHLTGLERRALDGELSQPERSESAALVARKGEEHEARYLARLRAEGNAITELPARSGSTLQAMRDAEAATLAAMERGDSLIYQPAFFDETFMGRADFLRRVEWPSARWPWSYEVVDAKLARSTKAYFLLQLSAYGEHVERLQGSSPTKMHVALGTGEERSYLCAEYAAYYRRIKAAFLEQAGGSVEHYPRSCKHCEVCAWTDHCERRRRDDDYLGLVARIRNDQIVKLTARRIVSVAQLARAADDARPPSFAEDSFSRLREQAALQVQQRDARASGLPPAQWYRYKLHPYDDDQGLGLLPEPDAGDIFFDIEGDPYYPPHGLEYLFGVYLPHENEYRAFWATSGAAEKGAVERFMDFVRERRERHPNLHIYHYANYEKVALGRLTGRYATRGDALDALLREQVFCDLYAVVRQSMLISQDGYSLKKLEPFYEFRRTATTKRGDDSIVQFESWLDSPDDDGILEDIRLYNDEDCRSTYELHRWLLARREELEQRDGVRIPWFDAARMQSTERQIAESEEHRLLREELLAGIPTVNGNDDLARLLPDARLRYFLGHILDYHRTDAKSEWWEYFNRRSERNDLTENDREAIGGLRLRADILPVQKAPRQNPWYTYEFPEQEYGLRDEEACDPKTGAACAIQVHEEQRLVEVKIPRSLHATPEALTALIPRGPIETRSLTAAIRETGHEFLRGELALRHPAIRDLLLAAPPRLRERSPGAKVQPDGDVDGDALAETIDALDGSCLFVQGPPGSGKSYVGGDAIARLLQRGLRVGVMTRSHKAAHNLLDQVERAARELGVSFTGVHGSGKLQHAFVSKLDSSTIVSMPNAEALKSDAQLVSGTQWLFANANAADRFDVLVVDEAGQLGLADVVAAGRSARNLVFLGDPLQLAQVTRGSHPPGVGVSVLEHLLGDNHTVPPDRGIFLPVTWRMHPQICDFVSRNVYDGRLHSVAGNEKNAIIASKLEGSGLRWMPVTHSGNRKRSDEEADAVVEAICDLLHAGVACRDHDLRPITAKDIMVVCAYNAQRVLIEKRLSAAGLDVRVGTVDTFQGQEAAVVFYSMATSSGEDLPRDMAFLFEKNRFNVAISRAKCVSVLVCSPRLLEIRCHSPEQMALANLLCAYTESAQTIVPAPAAQEPLRPKASA